MTLKVSSLKLVNDVLKKRDHLINKCSAIIFAIDSKDKFGEELWGR